MWHLTKENSCYGPRASRTQSLQGVDAKCLPSCPSLRPCSQTPLVPSTLWAQCPSQCNSHTCSQRCQLSTDRGSRQPHGRPLLPGPCRTPGGKWREAPYSCWRPGNCAWPYLPHTCGRRWAKLNYTLEAPAEPRSRPSSLVAHKVLQRAWERTPAASWCPQQPQDSVCLLGVKIPVGWQPRPQHGILSAKAVWTKK